MKARTSMKGTYTLLFDELFKIYVMTVSPCSQRKFSKSYNSQLGLMQQDNQITICTGIKQFWPPQKLKNPSNYCFFLLLLFAQRSQKKKKKSQKVKNGSKTMLSFL